MNNRLAAVCTAALLAAAPAHGQPAPAASAAASPHHRLDIRLDPAAHRLTATDEVTWPGTPPSGPRTFVLNASLAITRADPPVKEVPLAEALAELGLALATRVPLKAYRVAASGETTSLALAYEGVINTPLSDPKEEYTRGFRDTTGLIGQEGVYLAGSTVWHPRFGSELVTFDVTAAAPENWHVISQGSGTSRGADGKAHWASGGSMDEIYVVGGPLHQFKDSAGAIETLVYLHERDASIAGKYLAATAQYLEMYRRLIGPYPYGKFALVENFWETGYGMPTFTLLGPQVIRFPFIINSSYPHEILHNWWGNSVFVDYGTGNWCEGLTAYLADHLIQEQRGAAAEYRRSALQKYRDYVRTGRDFPLAEFRERFSAATEAVGYGKALMGYHALRLHIGDDAFRATFARFYREFKGRRATFRDIQRVAEAVSGKPLGWIFDDLITRPGAPVLDVKAGSTGVRQDGARFVVDGVLRQVQAGAPFTADVPVLVQTERGVTAATVRLDRAEQAFSIAADSRPLALVVDPHFDVFRRLDPRETPPSIGQIFGEPAILAVLPSDAGAAAIAAYREMLNGWQSDAHRITVVLDSDLKALPADRAAWIIGRTNRLAPALFGALPGLRVDAAGVEVDGEKMPLAGHTLIATFRHPANVEKAVGWIVADPVPALPGLGRKLPHYGKYSYLGFQGEEPANIIKGQWQQSDSPMRVDLRPDGRRGGTITPLPPDGRNALADLPPVFSTQALADHVAFLASPGLEGRGLGSPGLEKAAQYVADRFRAYGLMPGGDGGSYFQRFTAPTGKDGLPVEAANVVGILPGSNDAFTDQSAVLGAHLDHLGTGWPDVHAGDEGKVHPGADDNASGVAVLLELARVLAAGDRPPRTVLFIAFTGEEAGRLGSKHYAAHPVRPLAKTEGMINLDTVGRLGTQKITALGTGTATEWQHIFRGASFVTGIESRSVPESIESSDQVSFTEQNVPAVQIFTAAHADYHRPSDTADKIDVAGLAKVAAFVKEGIVYLAERPGPLTNTIKPASPKPQAEAEPASPKPQAEAEPASPKPQAEAGRRVSFGTVPDFAFPGPGVKVTGLVPESPAARAGIREGDIILRLNDAAVADLQGFSNLLRTFAAGQTVAVVLRRGSEDVNVSVTLAER
ncbi:MAG: M20/M25/M40 family metallo-hydrolase [Vicinamibacterales bacterium]